MKKLSAVLLFSMLVMNGLFSANAEAETRYVSEEMVVSLRSGKGEDYKVLKYMKSAAPLDVLDEADGYARVRTEDGTEGWVASRFIMSGKPKALYIKELEKKIKSLNETVDSLSKGQPVNVGDLKKETEKSKEEAARMAKELQELTGKYNKLVERSGRVIEISREYDRMKEENTRLMGVEEHLKKENERLVRRSTIYWFIAGSGVFFFGWIIGKLSRQRRRF